MTTAQWLFEFYSLQDKEERTAKQTIDILKAIRKLLVNLLGLDLLKEDEDNEDAFIPLSMLTGRREVVESILAKMEKEKLVQEAMDDNQFDKLSEAIANGKDVGDMEPMLEPVNVEDIRIKDMQRELTSLGVKIVDTPFKNVSHVGSDMTKIKEKIEASRRIGKTAEKEVNEIKNQPFNIKFNDDG